uniref:Synaptobrevin, longin-like domain protein n=1 Tax=Tanacetum cinerariifolium TaxID=118510 RepID=A0A699GXA3_TANCI|nr:hypothetical protein [Tanacetum cinerariifolium]
MALAFADTHNMIVFLSKLDASKGFEQIINFLNAHVIQYALMVIITEESIRQDLRLDDADSVDCLPNEEIFAVLARMGYEKPSTKLTFYKVFFSAQWKFLNHTILQCISAKRTTWNEFCSSMASAVICLATVGDLSSRTSKYTSPALTQKVFANIRRVGKGFSGVDTPFLLDKVAHTIEIIKLKQRVRRLEKKRQFKSSGLKRLRNGEIAKLDADKDVTLVDAEEDMDADVQGRLEESQAKVYHLDLELANKVLSMQETDKAEPAEIEEVIKEVTTAKRRRGVIIQDPEEASTASIIVHSEVMSKDKGIGILVEESKPHKRQEQIEEDEAFARY